MYRRIIYMMIFALLLHHVMHNGGLAGAQSWDTLAPPSRINPTTTEQQLSALAKAFRRGDKQERILATKALAASNHPKAMGFLVKIFWKEKDNEVRQEIIGAMGRAGSSLAAAGLLNLLKESFERQFIALGEVEEEDFFGDPIQMDDAYYQKKAELADWNEQLEAEFRQTMANALAQLGDNAVPRLSLVLVDADESHTEEMRILAAQILKQIKTPMAIHTLMHELTKYRPQDTSEIQSARESALEEIGHDAIPAVLTLLRDADPETRRKGISMLKGMAIKAKPDSGDWRVTVSVTYDARAIEPLIAALDDEDPEVRSEALDALSRYYVDEKIVPKVLAMLDHDPSAHVRSTAAWALGQMGEPRGILPLILRLNDLNKEMRFRAADMLGEIAAKIGAAAVIAHLEASSNADTALSQKVLKALAPLSKRTLKPEAIHSRVSKAMQKISQEGSLDRLLPALESADEETRVDLMQQIQPIADESAIALLAKQLQEKNPRVRRLAAEILSGIGGPNVVDALLIGLKDQDYSVRSTAAEGLGNTQSELAVLPLSNVLLRDENEHCRYEAARSLGKIESKTAMPALLHGLNDRDENVQRECIVSLGNLGDTTAIPVLRDRLTQAGKNGSIAQYALIALLKLGDGSFLDQGLEMFNDMLDSRLEMSWRYKDEMVEMIHVLGNFDSLETMPYLVRAMIMDPDEKIRKEASQKVISMHTDRVVLLLIQIVSKNSPEQPMSAENLAVFKELLIHGDAPIKCIAALLLGLEQEKEAVNDLHRLLNDASPSVQCFAAEALAHIAHPSSIKIFGKLLGDTNPKVQGWAARGLTLIGTAEALNELRRISRGSDATARRVAVGILRYMRLNQEKESTAPFSKQRAKIYSPDFGGTTPFQASL